MAEGKTYVTVIGTATKFGKDAPVVTTDEVNNQTVARFTLTGHDQKLFSITAWPELAYAVQNLQEGQLVAVHGEYRSSEKNGKTYHNVSAYTLSAAPVATPKEREVVNQQPAGGDAFGGQSAPAAAPAPAQSATSPF